uniref:Uncharacterized protein n=1 Tax=Peronospora matthiolae TaxID=2874970 RepID=A0AAV1ULZ0_9STRA
MLDITCLQETSVPVNVLAMESERGTVRRSRYSFTPVQADILTAGIPDGALDRSLDGCDCNSG